MRNKKQIYADWDTNEETGKDVLEPRGACAVMLLQ